MILIVILDVVIVIGVVFIVVFVIVFILVFFVVVIGILICFRDKMMLRLSIRLFRRHPQSRGFSLICLFMLFRLLISLISLLSFLLPLSVIFFAIVVINLVVIGHDRAAHDDTL